MLKSSTSNIKSSPSVKPNNAQLFGQWLLVNWVNLFTASIKTQFQKK